ncbi:MAG: CDP-glycerol glycerophosphotransferase family protein [Pseudomonadales bacterium]|nr:CDP-glycerol glycerophosphotransferase family protein [Pseudomonadales bacterium]
MNQIKLIASLFYKGIIYVLASILPKNKSVWVFGAWFGDKYSDNSKAFFQYVNQYRPQISAIWISKNNELIKELRNKGFRAYNMHSFIGIYYQLTASFAFVCQAHDVDLFAPTIGKKTKIVNLWHGLPLKKIIYDEFGHISIKKNLKGRIVDFLSPYKKMRNDYLIATNERTQKTLSGAFRIPIARVLITGFPRNDVFINQDSNMQSTAHYKVIYMPTMRKQENGSNALFENFGFNVDKISKELSKHNIKLVLRLHPVNKAPENLLTEIKASKNISFDFSDDIYDTIASYDCLVTDYSSIYFDFLLSKKPILFAPFDLSDYKEKERELYYEFEDVTLPPYSFNWPSLIENIINCKNSNNEENYNTSYRQLTDMFHRSNNNQKHSKILINKLNELQQANN